VLLAMGGLVSLVEDDDAFTDVPEFSGVVKPMPVRWLPTGSVAGFAEVAADLKARVDEMAEEK
jgi:hypothetical protein